MTDVTKITWQQAVQFSDGFRNYPLEGAAYVEALNTIGKSEPARKLFAKLEANSTQINPVTQRPFGKTTLALLDSEKLGYDSKYNAILLKPGYISAEIKTFKVHPDTGAKTLEPISAEEKIIGLLQQAATFQADLIQGKQVIDKNCAFEQEVLAQAQYVDFLNSTRTTRLPVRRKPEEVEEKIAFSVKETSGLFDSFFRRIGVMESHANRELVTQVGGMVLRDNGCKILTDDDAVISIRDVLSKSGISTSRLSNDEIRQSVVQERAKTIIKR